MSSLNTAAPVITILDLLRMLRRKIPVIALLFALIMAGVVAGAYLRKPAFDSTAKVLISFEGLGISLSRAEYQYGTTQVQAVEAITSQAELFRSHDLVEQVIEELGVEALRDPPPTGMIGRMLVSIVNFAGGAIESVLLRAGLTTKMEEHDILAAKLGKSLNVFPVRQSQILVVSVRWHRPEIAHLLLNKVMETYLSRSGDISKRANSYEIFAEQTKRLSEDLSKAEFGLLEFKLKNNILDLPREKLLLQSRIEKLSGLVDGMTPEPGAAAEAGEDPNIAVSQVSSLQSQLTSLKVELSRLRVSSTADNRAVRELESQVAEIEKLIAGILARAARTLEVSKARLRIVNEAEASYDRISRDVEMARDAYQTYRKVTEDRRVMQSRNMQINVQVIDNPSLPLEPTGPARLTMLIAGLPFSLICAIGLVLLLHFYRLWMERQLNARRGTDIEA
jgi:uncharacterized protein involved in exopolysaccharide biosynthesis